MITNKLLILSILIIFIVALGISMRRTGIKLCKAIKQEEAVSIIRNLPEIVSYLKTEKHEIRNQASQPTVVIDKETASSYQIQVYSDEEYRNNPDINSHTATFNWYTMDKCTGKIKCSFFIYDNVGKMVRASNGNEYPCN